MKIKRTEYKTVIENAEYEFSEADLKELNDYIIEHNPKFVPLTMTDVENATKVNIEGRTGEKIYDGLNQEFELNDFVCEFIEEVCWDLDYDTVDVTINDVVMEFEF